MSGDEKFGSFLFIPLIIATVSLIILADNLVCRLKFAEGVVKNTAYTDFKESGEAPILNVTLLSEPLGDKNLPNLNSATLEELDAIPGIGEARARAIVKQRERMDGFYSVGDVLCTPGIGTAVLKQIEDRFTVLK